MNNGSFRLYCSLNQTCLKIRLNSLIFTMSGVKFRNQMCDTTITVAKDNQQPQFEVTSSTNPHIFKRDQCPNNNFCCNLECANSVCNKHQTQTLPSRPSLMSPQCPCTMSQSIDGNVNRTPVGIRKYVIFCLLCGGSATLIGALFLGVSFILRSYTSTLEYFETIPTFVPALLLITLGICLMCLANSRNRYCCLIKSSGICCLVSAFMCILVTITTTLVHMSRLQTLRECLYTKETRTCTCYSILLESTSISTITDQSDDSIRFIFNSTPDCEVIHGALYSCLRAIFGLSVTGVLVCIFSSMLAYQLLNHEKKKMYWDQIEMRYRALYQQPLQQMQQERHNHSHNHFHQNQNQHQHQTQSQNNQNLTLGHNNNAMYWNCCGDECRFPAPVYQWEQNTTFDRFWNSRRVGNYYSPSPLENISCGPGERRSAWSWCRLPWTRAQVNNNHDSQYGFGINNNCQESDLPQQPISIVDRTVGPPGCSSNNNHHNLWDPPPPYSDPNSPRRNFSQPPIRNVHRHRKCQSQSQRTHAPYPNSIPEGQHVDNSKQDECVPSSHTTHYLPRLQGVENEAFKNSEAVKHDQNESDVYFADVSSCCNANDESSVSIYGDNGRTRLPKDYSENSLNSTQTQVTETTDDEEKREEPLEDENHYETIPEPGTISRTVFNSNLTSTIASVNNENACFHHKVKKKQCKHSAMSRLPNAPTVIVPPVDDVQGGSDATIDSGWQSEPERHKMGSVPEKITSSIHV